MTRGTKKSQSDLPDIFAKRKKGEKRKKDADRSAFSLQGL